MKQIRIALAAAMFHRFPILSTNCHSRPSGGCREGKGIHLPNGSPYIVYIGGPAIAPAPAARSMAAAVNPG
jgi:hypothetical protein